jgi:cell division protein FtsI/penicillin-binding protein 2
MRAKLFFYLCAVMATYLCARLYLVQVVQGPSLAAKALAQRSDTVEVFARRGFIADRNGTVLVRSLPSESVYAVPHDLTDPDATVAKLQAIFGKLDPATIAELHDKTVWFVWIARKVPVEIADRVRKADLGGVALKEEPTGKRIDMVGNMASTLLGFVGTDENGLAGLEYQFDDLLRGQSGQVTLETDDFGRPIPFGHESVVKAAQPGLSLELTIDSYLQFVTEEALDQEVAKYHAKDGTAIVMDPWTGEILAMANVPHFDPNHFWKYPQRDYDDRAVADTYEPGSTFKLITAARSS